MAPLPCGIDFLFPPETHAPQPFNFPGGIVNDHRRLTPWHLEPPAPRRQSLRCRNAGIRPVNRETTLCGDLVRRNRNDLALIRHFCPLSIARVSFWFSDSIRELHRRRQSGGGLSRIPESQPTRPTDRLRIQSRKLVSQQFASSGFSDRRRRTTSAVRAVI